MDTADSATHTAHRRFPPAAAVVGASAELAVGSAAMDAARCPLCGGPNGCAMVHERETARPQPPCWCTHMTFSEAVLKRVPPAARGRACVCAQCARAQD